MPLAREDYPGGGRAIRGALGTFAGGAIDTGWHDTEAMPNGTLTLEVTGDTDLGAGNVRVLVSNQPTKPASTTRGAILSASLAQAAVSWVGATYRWVRVVSNATPPDVGVAVVFFGWEARG